MILMIPIAVYNVGAETLQRLWLLWLIPLAMILISFLIIRKNKISTDRKWSEDDKRVAERMAEIAAEKALEDDFSYEKFNDDGEYIGDSSESQKK